MLNTLFILQTFDYDYPSKITYFLKILSTVVPALLIKYTHNQMWYRAIASGPASLVLAGSLSALRILQKIEIL